MSDFAGYTCDGTPAVTRNTLDQVTKTLKHDFYKF